MNLQVLALKIILNYHLSSASATRILQYFHFVNFYSKILVSLYFIILSLLHEWKSFGTSERDLD